MPKVSEVMIKIYFSESKKNNSGVSFLESVFIAMKIICIPIRFSLKTIAIIFLFNAVTVQAFDFDPKFEVNAFGSLGASMTNATEVTAVNFLTKVSSGVVPEIQGIGASPTFLQDTYGGLRFKAAINQDISLTVQMLSEGTVDYAVETDWLYAQWNVNDEWEVKIGRTRLPLLMLSQYLKIAYAYPWTRPPLEVYNFFSVSDFSGILIQNTEPLANGWVSYATLGLGESHDVDTVFSGTSLSLRKLATIEWIIANPNFRVRANYLRGDLDSIFPSASIGALQTLLVNPCARFETALSPELVTVTHPAVLAAGQCLLTPVPGIPPISPRLNVVTPDPATAQMFNSKNVNAQFLSFGYDWSWNHFLSLAEWKKTNTGDRVINDSISWYVLGGITWDDLTFHLTYSKFYTTDNSQRILSNTISSTFINPFSLFNPAPIPTPETMQTSINKLLAALNFAQSTIDAGVRYDIIPGVALKFDYRYVTVEQGTRGFFSAGPLATAPGKRISWVTAAVDVVF